MKFSIALSFVFIILPGFTHVSAFSRRAAAAAADDPQTSLTLDPKVIATGFAQNGQEVPAAGQVASLTSKNNFINFCLTVNLPITNGKQIASGSCNPAPMGAIPSSGNMPSSQFTNPTNGATIPANKAFTVSMNINNMITGNFVNADSNYFAAPQQLQNGQILGHSHVVIQDANALNNPAKFVFFKGLNDAAQGGALTADVTAGIPAGSYRICSINTAANHQPALVPIAQHGGLDDCVYFTATDGGASASSAAAASSGAAAATATVDGGAGANTATTATTTSAAGASATDKGDSKSSATDSTTATATATATAAATGKDNGKVSRAGGKAQR